MNLVFYGYDRCGTCTKAVRFLAAYPFKIEKIAIRENPPSLEQLQRLLQEVGEIKKLFNTSGKDYRTGNWKEKLREFGEKELLEALVQNGNLIKRPLLFSVNSKKIVLVGFKEEIWKSVLENALI